MSGHFSLIALPVFSVKGYAVFAFAFPLFVVESQPTLSETDEHI